MPKRHHCWGVDMSFSRQVRILQKAFISIVLFLAAVVPMTACAARFSLWQDLGGGAQAIVLQSDGIDLVLQSMRTHRHTRIVIEVPLAELTPYEAYRLGEIESSTQIDVLRDEGRFCLKSFVQGIDDPCACRRQMGEDSTGTRCSAHFKAALLQRIGPFEVPRPRAFDLWTEISYLVAEYLYFDLLAPLIIDPVMRQGLPDYRFVSKELVPIYLEPVYTHNLALSQAAIRDALFHAALDHQPHPADIWAAGVALMVPAGFPLPWAGVGAPGAAVGPAAPGGGGLSAGAAGGVGGVAAPGLDAVPDSDSDDEDPPSVRIHLPSRSQRRNH